MESKGTKESKESKSPKSFFRLQRIMILVAFAVGFLISQLLRNVNAVSAPYLDREFKLGSEQLGLMTAMYFLSFAAAQIPLGLLLDRFSPWRIQVALLACALLGCLLFALAPSVGWLIVARLIIGFGVSGCLMCGLKSLDLIYQRKYVSRAYGWYMLFAGIGILTAGLPTQFIISLSGWRGAFFIISILLLLAIILVYGCKVWMPHLIKANPESSGLIHESNNKLAVSGVRLAWQDVTQILSNRTFWSVAPVVGINGGIFMALIGIWIADYMRKIQFLPNQEVAIIISGMAIAMIVGSPLAGAISKPSTPKPSTPKSGALNSQNTQDIRDNFNNQRASGNPGLTIDRWQLIRMLLISLPAPVFMLLAVLPAAELLFPSQYYWVLVALFNTVTIQFYTIVSTNLSQRMSGIAITAVNLVLFIGAFVFQYGIGWLLETLFNHTDLQFATSYQIIMYSCVALSFISILFCPYLLRNHLSTVSD